MKNYLFILISFICTLLSVQVNAQSFSVADTVYGNVSGLETVNIDDPVTVPAGDSTRIDWGVVATNFPADWLVDSVLGICDNILCFNFTTNMWNGTMGNVYTSAPYHATSTDYHMQLVVPNSATNGTYYLRVKMKAHGLSDSTYTTFVVSKFPLSVPNFSTPGDVTVYPNPAIDAIHLSYSASAGVSQAVVLDMMGKVVSVDKVMDSSATIGTDRLSPGVYFIRLLGVDGSLLAVKRFTKQ